MPSYDSITLPIDLKEHTEIIDVRSPAEFAIDHIPGAINLPVLNNEERIEVGTLYKNSPFEGRRLGAGLISANASRYLAGYLADKGKDYSPLLYCWRGGMRSRSLTHILSTIGWNAKLLNGGYRAFRKFVVNDLEHILTETPLKLTVLSGLTGVGKTRMLHALKSKGEQVLDLEGLANHKGSLLGNPQIGEQPSQKKFETRLWHTLSEFDLTKPIWTEAESNRIGNVHCPSPLWKKLGEGVLVELDLSIEHRSQLLIEDYPHFCEDPDSLSELLNVLRRMRGNELVDRWQDQLSKAQWQPFLSSILTDHYDLSYRRPEDQKSNYTAAVAKISIESAAQESYNKGANELIQLKL